MKITAIMLVRNEENILRTSVGYLLYHLRVHQIIIADNGSTDSTRSIAQQLSTGDERVEWTDVTGPYRQSEITTGIAREAYLKGSDWILANDADEFFWLGSHDIHNLCASKSAGAYAFSVRNFVQWRWVLRDHPRSCETMVFSVRSVGPRETARQRVESKQLAFVQAPYLPKLFVRAAQSLVIHQGNHGADGFDGEAIKLDGAEVLHAPIRSRGSVIDRVDRGQRVAELGLPDNFGWTVRRLTHLAPAELEDEWRMNSTIGGLIGPLGQKKWLRLDLRLRRIAQSQHRV
jgi:glycosyltransferase involved in cell wall biosynthesis